MSDSSSNLSKSYWNGEFVGQVNSQYRELINIDPDVVPYIDKLSLTSFFAKSRKGYVSNYPSLAFQIENETRYRTTDIRKINDTGCGDGDCFNIFYQISPDGSRYRVIKRDCDTCDSLTIVDKGYRCVCDSEKFFDLDFPIGDVIKEGIGTQSVEEGVLYKFSDDSDPFESIPSGGDVYVGDYIVFYDAANNAKPGQCGIYRQISGVFDGYIQLDTGYNEIDEANREGKLVSYKIFRNTGATVGWVGNSGINVYNRGSEFTRVCGTWGACLQSVVNHNGIINILTDKGYNIYGGIGENILYFSALNSTFLGKDKINSVSFGNFLVFFGNNSIDAIVFSDDGQFSYKYRLSDMSYSDFGIYSKNAFGVFDNGLYLIGNDKRLYPASIAGGGDRYYLQLDNQSDLIFPDLDLLQEGDEVSIDSYQNKLYIFINGRLYSDNYNLDKTKILIFNKDYGLWYKHIIPRGVINGTKYGLFYGDGLYQYIGDRDVYILGSLGEEIVHYAPIKSEVVFDIVNSENHGIVNSLGNRVSLMSEKKINWIKLLLGAGIYTENSYIEIDSYMSGYRFTKKIPFTENEWFNNWIEYFDGEYNNIEVSECFGETLSTHDNMASPYEGSSNNTDVREELKSPICEDSTSPYEIKYDSKRLDDYAICYDDKGYRLSPIEHMYVNPGLKYHSILYTVKIVSDGYDRMNLGGAVVEYESYPINYKNKSRYDIEINCEQ